MSRGGAPCFLIVILKRLAGFATSVCKRGSEKMVVVTFKFQVLRSTPRFLRKFGCRWDVMCA